MDLSSTILPTEVLSIFTIGKGKSSAKHMQNINNSYFPHKDYD